MVTLNEFGQDQQVAADFLYMTDYHDTLIGSDLKMGDVFEGAKSDLNPYSIKAIIYAFVSGHERKIVSGDHWDPEETFAAKLLGDIDSVFNAMTDITPDEERNIRRALEAQREEPLDHRFISIHAKVFTYKNFIPPETKSMMFFDNDPNQVKGCIMSAKLARVPCLALDPIDADEILKKMTASRESYHLYARAIQRDQNLTISFDPSP